MYKEKISGQHLVNLGVIMHSCNAALVIGFNRDRQIKPRIIFTYDSTRFDDGIFGFFFQVPRMHSRTRALDSRT